MRNITIIYFLIIYFFLSSISITSCGLFNTDPGPQNNTNTNTTSPNVYAITWTGPTTDPYYQICSINCDIITTSTDLYYQLSPTAANGSSNISWISNSDELPYIFFYTYDGITTEKKFLTIASPVMQSQSITVTLTALGNSAVFTNDTQHITVKWNYYDADNNVIFIINGYGSDGLTIIDTQITGTGGSGIMINSFGHYDIWLSIKGSRYLLNTGNATAH